MAGQVQHPILDNLWTHIPSAFSLANKSFGCVMKSDFILQGVTPDNHLDTVKGLLSLEDPSRVIIGTAFMNHVGVSLLSEELSKVSKQTTIFVGIRNGVTTAQGILEALKIGCNVYSVDTGSRSGIFHPKIYLSKNGNEAGIISGSANLTFGGLVSNIEASINMALNLEDKQSNDLVDQIIKKFDAMIKAYPENVSPISNEKDVKNLLDAGRLIDESVKIIPTAKGTVESQKKDKVPKMKLHKPSFIFPKKSKAKATSKLKKPILSKAQAIQPEGLSAVWRLDSLSRRDLSIPKSGGTSLTGSMLFKKSSNDIDVKTYFRNNVFNELKWVNDPKSQGKELAEATFAFIIKSVSYGTYTLTLTHDKGTHTKAIERHQPLTAIRWGDVRPLISDEGLLGRSLVLYKDNTNEDNYIIEID